MTTAEALKFAWGIGMVPIVWGGPPALLVVMIVNLLGVPYNELMLLAALVAWGWLMFVKIMPLASEDSRRGRVASRVLNFFQPPN